MRWTVLLLASCSFSPPSLPGAKQACIDWTEACRAKSVSCGTSVEDAAVIYRNAIALCDSVQWADEHKVYEECIPDVLAATCEDAPALTCHGFVR